eukprot:345927_1
MKSILALLLALPYVLGVETTGRPRHQQAGDTRQCIQGAVCLDFRDGDPISFRARGHIRRCPTPDHGCGIIRKFGVSRELNDERTDVDPNTVNKGYKTINMGCVAPGLCEKIVGGTSGSGCAYTDYQWNRFQPQSCNETRDFDARTFRQNVRLVYACCNGDDCFTQAQANADDVTRENVENTCTHNTNLGEYIEELHKCWNTRRAAFREFFTCAPIGMALVEFREVCRDPVYGEYNRTLADPRRGTVGEQCRWRPTCSEDLQKLIESFGECACTAADTKGFTGEAIGALMESYWNDFCPQIEISCAGEGGTLFLRRRRRRRRIKFRLAKAKTYVEGQFEDWKAKMAEYLRINPDDIDEVVTIEVDESGDGANGRRLLADSTVVNIDVYGDDTFNNAINDDACSETGLQATFQETALEKISCDYSDVEDALFGSDASGSATTAAPET